MALDNVVPIDAEAARLLARRTTRLRWFVATLTALWAAVLVPTLVFTPLPPIGPFVALAILVVLAEHRFVLFGDETSMSASIIVVVASVFVFADSSPLAGPMLIASLGGIYLPHLRRGNRVLAAANVSAFGIAAAIAACLSFGLGWSDHPDLMRALIAGAVCACSYWYANSVLIGCASAIRHGDDLRQSVAQQAKSEWPVLVLAVGSAVTALGVPRLDPVALVLSLSLLLCAFEVHVRRERGSTHPTTWSWLARNALVVGITVPLAVGCGGPCGAAIAAMGTFILLVDAKFVRGAGVDSVLAISASYSALLPLDRAGLPEALQFVVATVIAFIVFAARDWRRQEHLLGLRIERLAVAGLLIPGRREVLTLAVLSFALHASSGVISPGIPRMALFVATVIGIRALPAVSHRSHGLDGFEPVNAQRSSAPASR